MATRGSLKYYLLTILILVLGNVFVWQFIFQLDNRLKVVFFDVGEGDSIFIQTPFLHQILIDGGPTSQVIDKLGKQMPFWDKTLDVVMLTHPDYDHLRGLLDVLENYKVKLIVYNGAQSDSKTWQKWLAQIEKENARVVLGKKGTMILAGDVKMAILYPFEHLALQTSNNNQNSLVAKLSFGAIHFLFTGDADKTAEEAMLLSQQDLKSQVLKVSHHGSASATSAEFLNAVLPLIAVISVGKDNSYHHPHQQVLNNLAQLGITVLRTDQRGDIKILSDGKSLIY